MHVSQVYPVTPENHCTRLYNVQTSLVTMFMTTVSSRIIERVAEERLPKIVKGAVPRNSVIFFALFCASKIWRLLAQVSRTSDHISSVSRANSFTAQLSRENVVFLQKMSFSAAFPCGRHHFSPHIMAAKNH